jgi:hypothetical protein
VSRSLSIPHSTIVERSGKQNIDKEGRSVKWEKAVTGIVSMRSDFIKYIAAWILT